MKLTVLGKYGPFPGRNGATSGYLLEGENTTAVLDLGSNTLSRLLNKVKPEQIGFIVLSHLHFDHICDILPLSYALDFAKVEGLNLYLPKCDLPILATLKSLKAFNLIYIEEGVTYTEGEFSFSFYKTSHPVISYGIKITNGKRTLAYTGDSVYCENLKPLVENANLIVADGAFLEKDHNSKLPHMSIKEAVSLEKFTSNGKVMVSHINYAYTDLEVEEEIKRLSKTSFIAKENETYYI